MILGEERDAQREGFDQEKINLARSIGDQTASALKRVELFREIEDAYLQTVLALANAVDAKDSYTADHGQRMGTIAQMLGQELSMKGQQLDELRYSAILHDVGKIGIPDSILQKPGALNKEEWAQMYEHPIIGEQIVSPIQHLADASSLVRHHHERFDGTGYPDRLAGEDIPKGARILAVVDAYCAMIDERVYKEAISHEDALDELVRNAGTQFDPDIVVVFIEYFHTKIDAA
jgi:HD-GYP domain-containing protein (c-di-GMP phosphodiesterase class II)